MGSVLLAAVFIALQFVIAKANPDSKRLYDDLLSNYNRLIRPVGNNSDRLTVKMGLRLSQLIDVVSTGVTRAQIFIQFLPPPTAPISASISRSICD
jgi:Neurotransmitter-gated ion-channel ligand binding domain